MTNRKSMYLRYRNADTYVPEHTSYRKNSEANEYYVLPTRFPRRRYSGDDTKIFTPTKPIPKGWTDISGITGPTVRRIDDGYIRQRLSRNGMNIAGNQAYIRRILENPKTPQCNRDAAISFVMDHPEYFIPRPEDTGNPAKDRYNRTINGSNPDRRFVSKFI